VAAEQQQQLETESRKVSTNSGRDEQQNGSRRQHHSSNGILSLSRFAKEEKISLDKYARRQNAISYAFYNFPIFHLGRQIIILRL
jgi:hypothetical protein